MTTAFELAQDLQLNVSLLRQRCLFTPRDLPYSEYSRTYEDRRLFTARRDMPLTEIPDGLGAFAMAADERPDKLNWRDLDLLTFHRFDVSEPNPHDWVFTERGWTGVDSSEWDKIGSMESEAQRQQLVESLLWVKLFWVPALAEVERSALSAEPIVYYRLLLPVGQEIWAGMVEV